MTWPTPAVAAWSWRPSTPGTPNGTIAVMSWGRVSVTNNDKGGFEVYRASESALNQLAWSFAARHADDPRTLLLRAPAG